MTVPAGYAKFRDTPGCGWITGTVYTGPRVCTKPAKATAEPVRGFMQSSTVNGRVCGLHARVARGRDYTVTPIQS